jgi:hypothetical protein
MSTEALACCMGRWIGRTERLKIFRLMTESGVQAAVSVARIRSALFWRGWCGGVG